MKLDNLFPITTYVMPCLFGYGFHDLFCLCQIVTASNSDLHSFIYSPCEARLRSEYKDYLTLERNNIKEKVDFELFLAYFTGERLKDMAAFGRCEHGLSDSGYVMGIQRLIAAFNLSVGEKGMELVSDGLVQDSQKKLCNCYERSRKGGSKTTERERERTTKLYQDTGETK